MFTYVRVTLREEWWRMYKHQICLGWAMNVYGEVDCLVETLMMIVPLRRCLNYINCHYSSLEFRMI